MITKELLEYIKQESIKGVPLEDIKKVLLENGWGKEDLEVAFKNLYPPTVVSTGVSLDNTKVNTVSTISPKDNLVKPVANVVINNPIVNSTASPLVNPIVNPISNPINNYVDNTTFAAQVVPNTNINNNVVNPYLPNQDKVSKSKLKTIFSIIIVFIVLTGGGLATYGYFSGYFLSPLSILGKSMNATQSLKSESLDSTTTIDWSNMKTEGADSMSPLEMFGAKKMILTYKVDTDDNDVNNPKFSSEIGLDTGNLNAAFELRFINKVIYAQIKKAPVIPFLGDLSFVENQWVNFAPDALNNDSNATNDSTKAGVDSIIPLDSLKANQKILEGLTQEQKDKVLEITKNAKFIKTVKKMANEDINGESSYHITFELDSEGLKTYLLNIEDYVKTIPGISLPTTLSKEDLDKAFSTFKFSPDEIWVGKTDYLPRKLILNFEIVDAAQPANGSVNISSVMSFSNWNKVLPIVAPTESKPFKEFMDQFLSGAQTRAIDTEIKSSLSSFGDLAKSYNESRGSYKGFCLSKEVKNFSDNLKASSKNVLKLSCKDAKDKYIVSTTLNDGTYFCVDSTSSPKAVSKEPTGLVCE